MSARRALQLYNVFGAMTERVWLQVPLALRDRGWESVFAAESIAPEAPPMAAAIVPRLGVNAGANVEREISAIAARPPAVAQRFDIVHGHTGPRLLHAAPYLARGIPAIISLYGYDASRLLCDRAWVRRYGWAAARGATFVVLCDAMRDRLVREGLPPESIRIIQLGLELESWTYAPAPAPPRPRFVFVGRLTAKKGIADLIRALARLRTDHKAPATVEIIGAGPLDAEMRALAAKLEIGEHIVFRGAVPRERIAERIAGATALVLPSVTASDGDAEGTPIVLMEAQAVGVPCITTRHSGNPEVLPPQSPFVVPESDPARLASAMALAIELDPAERRALQDAGRRWIEIRFDLRAAVEQYATLYQELISAPRQA